jgi:transcriptional regulator of arginine metabolism
MHKYSLNQRREMIARVVSHGDIHTQDELLKVLRREGVRVTQPTLSRDIAEIGLVKTPSGYTLPASITGQDDPLLSPQTRRDERLAQNVRDFVVDVRKAGTMVVVKTIVAAAQPVARAIDEASMPEVVGTLGGDDTIFLATGSDSDAERVIRRLSAHIRTSRSTRRGRA